MLGPVVTYVEVPFASGDANDIVLYSTYQVAWTIPSL